jgi:hypothetical protein
MCTKKRRSGRWQLFAAAVIEIVDTARALVEVGSSRLLAFGTVIAMMALESF